MVLRPKNQLFSHAFYYYCKLHLVKQLYATAYPKYLQPPGCPCIRHFPHLPFRGLDRMPCLSQSNSRLCQPRSGLWCLWLGFPAQHMGHSIFSLYKFQNILQPRCFHNISHASQKSSSASESHQGSKQWEKFLLINALVVVVVLGHIQGLILFFNWRVPSFLDEKFLPFVIRNGLIF